MIFSNIPDEIYTNMLIKNNIKTKGKINFAETSILLEGVQLTKSFRQQMQLIRKYNVAAVISEFVVLIS